MTDTVWTRGPLLADALYIVERLDDGGWSRVGIAYNSPHIAALWASAPDLYDLLARADRLIDWDATPLGRGFQEEVEAALAKARGKNG